MTNTIANFQISEEEDLRFQLDFVGLDLTGRTLKVNVRERSSGALKVSLAAPANLTLVGTGNLTVFYAKSSMSTWAKGEYEADVVDETGGSFTRIMAVRFVYDEPGKLVYGVKGTQATVKWGGNQAVVTAIGGVGPPGPANILTIGDVETLETGEEATAEITGDAPNQELHLGLPKGNTGTAATITVGDVVTGAPGSAVEVVNSGTSGAAVFDFTIPAGDQGDQGDKGDKGWSPEFAVVADAGRRVLQVVDWAGGEGTEPATGDYVGATGLVSDIADAVDIRGDQGPPGSVADGDKGDITVSSGGTAWNIDAGAITTAKIGDANVTTVKIADASVTTAKLADEVKLLMRGDIFGLTLANNGTDANNDVDIAVGGARDSTNAYSLILASGLTKRLDAAWAVGTGNGGLDTGSKANSTTYHLHLIRRASDGVIDALFSTSATAPTMPSGWTARRRLGAVLTDGSGNIRSFRQTGEWFYYRGTPPLDHNGAATTPTALLRKLSVPNGVKVIADIGVTLTANSATGGGVLIATDPDLGVPAATGGNVGLGFLYHENSIQQNVFSVARIWTDTAQQLYFADSQTTPAVSIYVYTRGWFDPRDRYL